MKILFLTRIYPYLPATGGDMVYSSGLIEALARDCDLTVLTGGNGAVPYGERTENGVRWKIVKGKRGPAALSLASSMPNIVWRFATPEYRAALKALLDEPWDGIVVDHFGSAHVVEVLEARRRAGGLAPVMYLSHEFEASARAEKYATYGGNPVKQALLRHDGEKIATWEMKLVDFSDIVSVINPNEEALYREQAPAKAYITTTPGYTGPKVPHRTIDTSVPRRVALLGGRGSQHKQVILKRWLEVSAGPIADAGIEMEVIGALSDDLRAEIESRFPTVKVRGFVDDLTAHLQTCRLAVIPDFVGRGVKLRLLSLIFARVPLVGLEGAIDGLPLKAGRDYLEAASLEDLVEAVTRNIDRTDTLDALQASAFDACAGKYDWADRSRGILGALTSFRRAADAA